MRPRPALTLGLLVGLLSVLGLIAEGAQAKKLTRTYAGGGDILRVENGVSKYYAFTVGQQNLTPIDGRPVVLHSFTLTSSSRQLYLQVTEQGYPNVLLVGNVPKRAHHIKVRGHSAVVGGVIWLNNFLTGQPAGSFLLEVGGTITGRSLRVGIDAELGLSSGVMPGTSGSYGGRFDHVGQRLPAARARTERPAADGTYTGTTSDRTPVDLTVGSSGKLLLHYQLSYAGYSCNGGEFSTGVTPGVEEHDVSAQVAPNGDFVSDIAEPEYYSSGAYGGQRFIEIDGTFRRHGDSRKAVYSVTGNFNFVDYVYSGLGRGAVCTDNGSLRTSK